MRSRSWFVFDIAFALVAFVATLAFVETPEGGFDVRSLLDAPLVEIAFASMAALALAAPNFRPVPMLGTALAFASPATKKRLRTPSSANSPKAASRR
jgi:hypothetical protein